MLSRREGIFGGVLIAIDVLVWALAGWVPTDTFAWFRVQDRLGVAGFTTASVVGLLAAALSLRGGAAPRNGVFLLAAVAALLATLGAPQSHVDTLDWFSRAQGLNRGEWPALLGGGGGLRMPLVPLVDAMAFRLFGESEGTVTLVRVGWWLLLVGAVGAGARTRGGSAALAASVVATTPLVAASAGWMLADLPLAALLAATWAAARRGAPPLAVAAFALLAFTLKPVAALWLLATLPLLLPRRAAVALGALTGALLAVVFAVGQLHPRLRPWALNAEAAGAILVALRAPLLLAGVWYAVRGRHAPAESTNDALPRLVAGVLGVLALLVVLAPPPHAARYALPALVPLAWLLAERARLLAGWAVGTGLVLGFGGYAPLVTGSQAENVRVAVEALEAAGVDAIEVVADTPSGTLPVAALTALADVTATVPVQVGAQLSLAEPGARPRWYHRFEARPWHLPGATPPRGILLLCTPGAVCEPPADAGREVVDARGPMSTSLDLPTRCRGFLRR